VFNVLEAGSYVKLRYVTLHNTTFNIKQFSAS